MRMTIDCAILRPGKKQAADFAPPPAFDA